MKASWEVAPQVMGPGTWCLRSAKRTPLAGAKAPRGWALLCAQALVSNGLTLICRSRAWGALSIVALLMID